MKIKKVIIKDFISQLFYDHCVEYIFNKVCVPMFDTTNESNALRINESNKIRNTANFPCLVLYGNDELYVDH